MTRLSDLFDVLALEYALQERHVVARKHPTAPLTILNYADRCQYEPGLWNDVTKQCRGLIHDDQGRVLARPFSKFFNYGQSEGAQIAPDEIVEVTDKLDGSLGILYPVGNGFAVATRGSFESDQALHATALWNARYAHIEVPDGFTLLFEIIYPQNRIVCDYGAMDDLVLLGAVEIATGRSLGPSCADLIEWPGPKAERFIALTLADALAIPARRNAEGVVIRSLTSGVRLKVKQEDYVALHRIVTGLNERTVWEHCRDGKPLSDLLDNLPDEFHGWVQRVATSLWAQVEGAETGIRLALDHVTSRLPTGYTRKDFALAIKDHPQKSALFQMLDGKDVYPGIWERVKPEPRIGPRGVVPQSEAA